MKKGLSNTMRQITKDITLIGGLSTENTSGAKITIDLNGNNIYWVPKIPLIGTDSSFLSLLSISSR